MTPSPSTMSESVLHGEFGPKPRNAFATTVLALTTLLFFARAGRFIARHALHYRVHGELALTERGLELHEKREMLGRVLRERHTIVPIGALQRLTREVRFPRLGLYGGLTMLTLGTFIGIRFIVDGFRVPGLSGPLLGLGALTIVLGILLDFLLTSFLSSQNGHCRLLVFPRKGTAMSLEGLEPAVVDKLLTRVRQQLASS